MSNNISTSFVSQLQVGKRRDKTNYYLDIAEVVAERASCYKTHKGCIIVKDDRLISSGYNGAPRGRQNCMDLGYCVKDNFKIPFDKCYELCRGVHAEMNAINAAARPDTDGSTMYLVGVDANTMCYLEDFEPCTFVDGRLSMRGYAMCTYGQTVIRLSVRWYLTGLLMMNLSQTLADITTTIKGR